MLKFEKVMVGIWCFVCLIQAFLYDPLLYVNIQHIDRYFFGPLTIDTLLTVDVVNLFLFFAPMLICAFVFGLYGIYKLFKNIQKKNQAR